VIDVKSMIERDAVLRRMRADDGGGYAEGRCAPSLASRLTWQVRGREDVEKGVAG
jgi:hypothetical protein